jgi:MFS family permease
VTTGGGLGLLAFGPISQRFGRRSAFLLFQVCGLVCAVVVFQWIASVSLLLVALPVFGFWTLGMHAGFAVYFPELYPTRLRATGAGFCFNAGRFVAAPTLFIIGWLRDARGYTLPDAATMLSTLFIVGIAALAFAPETRWQELPE